MNEKRYVTVDVSVSNMSNFDTQVIVPKYYQSYYGDNIGDMHLEDLRIENLHMTHIFDHSHYEIEIPKPCRIDFETVKKYWNEFVQARVQKNKEIDKENKMNMRIPYEKYCAECENKMSKPSRLEYVKSHDLSKYGYKEQFHVAVPSGDVVGWSIVQEFD